MKRTIIITLALLALCGCMTDQERAEHREQVKAYQHTTADSNVIDKATDAAQDAVETALPWPWSKIAGEAAKYVVPLLVGYGLANVQVWRKRRKAERAAIEDAKDRGLIE